MMRAGFVLAIVGFLGWLSIDKIESMLVYPLDNTEIDPHDVGLPMVTAQRFANDGETLVVWTAAPKPGRPVVFYLHGNAGGLADRAGRFSRFVARGYGLVALGYRGGSGSSGTPSEPAITSDTRALWASDLIPPDAPIVVYGESLGTGVATVALFGGHTSDRAPSGLVLEAPYTSIPDVVRAAYPQFVELVPDMVSTWDSLSATANISVPLFVMHGRQDNLIPIAQGRRVFDAARSDQKRFLEVKTAGHTDLWRSDTLPVLWRFIDNLP